MLERLNNEMSIMLDVSKLDLRLSISKEAKSKFGHCSVKSDYYDINISEFVIGSCMEEFVIKHEICHAYDYHYFKSLPNNNDPYPHGIAWRELMKAWGYPNVKAQGLNLNFFKDEKFSITKENNYYHIYSNKLKIGSVEWVNENKIHILTGNQEESKIIEEIFIKECCVI